MAKHTLKIGNAVQVSPDYQTTDRMILNLIEDEAEGEIVDLNEFDDERYHVLFDGYLTDEDTDVCLWFDRKDLDRL